LKTFQEKTVFTPGRGFGESWTLRCGAWRNGASDGQTVWARRASFWTSRNEP